MLIDSYGRTLDYLRISITDRCNLRCIYCMPVQGIKWTAHKNILTFEEIIRVVNILTNLGIKKVRVTGGEPLLRRGATDFLNKLKLISSIENITLTTNGILLNEYIKDIHPNGINISLDTLDNERYRQITGCKNTEPQKIISIIERLLEKNINVKINCVPLKGINEDDILPIALLAKDKNITVRFIELMSLGIAASYKSIPGSEAARLIEKKFGALSPFSGILGNGPAKYYSLPGFTGKIGFINPITKSFCESCNRLRLTSEGFLKLCLSEKTGIDLRKPLRDGVSDEEISQAIIKAVKNKPALHTFSKNHNQNEKHENGMSGIGG